MQSTPPVIIVVSILAALWFIRMSRQVATTQPNRGRAFLCASVAVAVLAINGIVNYLGIDMTAWQTVVSAVAMAGMAGAGFFLVRAALRGEAAQLQQEAKRQAAQYRQERDHDTPDKRP